MFHRLVVVLVSGVATVATANPSPSIPTEAMPTVKCVYGLLKSNRTVQSVGAYAIDGFRSAVEYTFRDKDGNEVVSNVELFGSDGFFSTYAYKRKTELSEAEEKTEGEKLDFLEGMLNDLRAQCHITPSFDNLFPQPKSREEWRRVDLAN